MQNSISMSPASSILQMYLERVEKGNHIWLSIDLESEEELKAIYNALSQNGKIKMELQDTFWGTKYGVITDKFGLIWELSFSK